MVLSVGAGMVKAIVAIQELKALSVQKIWCLSNILGTLICY